MKPKGPAETYILSSSPHARAPSSVRDIMLDVIVAALPALICGTALIWRFDPAAGLHSLFVTATCVSTCILTEMACRRLMKREQTVGDLSCIVTGLLLAACLPPDLPLWMCIAGSVFAIAIAKQAFGGLGYNPFNPAAAGRAFMLISFTGAMTTWSSSGWIGAFAGSPAFAGKFADAPGALVTSATPLAALKPSAGFAAEMSHWNWEFLGDLFCGAVNGSIGEVSALALLAGGIYLIWRRVITWHIPVAFLGSMAVFAFAAFPPGGCLCETIGARSAYAAVHLLAGGAMIGAFFMATDMVTSPLTTAGKIVFGCGCGVVTMSIRLWGGYPEGVSFAILIMNAFVPIVNRYTRSKPFGWREARRAARAKAKAAAKEAK